MRLRLVWLWTSTLILAVGGFAAPAPPAAIATRMERAALPAAFQVKTERLTFRASDGTQLVGTLYLPEEKRKEGEQAPVYPGVILLPMHVETRQDWDWMARRLVEEKFAVLAMDLRSLGESQAQPDWQMAIGDAVQVWREFGSRPDVDEKRLAILGASIGANLALNAAAAEPAIPTVILLSPGLNYRGVTTNQALENLDRRRILVIASREDALAAGWPARMQELAPGKIELKLVEGNAHGSRLLDAPSGLERTILQWMLRGNAWRAAPASQGYGVFVAVFFGLAGVLGFAVILVAAWLVTRRLRRT